MDYQQAVITGFVQGFTEFLPISSSAHLAFTSALYNLYTGKELMHTNGEEVFFDILLHVATLIAVCVYFRKELYNVLMIWCGKTVNLPENEYLFVKTLPKLIIIGTIGTLIVVLPFKDLFEAQMSEPATVAIQLIITGFLIYITEKISEKFTAKKANISSKEAFIIGLAQGVAVAPGISRSGATIAGALALGIDRVTATKYSFLLLIPIVIMAAAHHGVKFYATDQLITLAWGPMMAGFVVSGVVGYYCVKYFIDFVGKHNMNFFAYYCWVVGLIMFIFVQYSGFSS